MSRYRRAEIVALDIAGTMLEQARKRGRWLRRPRCICGDLDHLPLADASVDLVFANAALQWSTQPHAAFADIARILRPGIPAQEVDDFMHAAHIAADRQYLASRLAKEPQRVIQEAFEVLAAGHGTGQRLRRPRRSRGRARETPAGTR